MNQADGSALKLCDQALTSGVCANKGQREISVLIHENLDICDKNEAGIITSRKTALAVDLGDC